MFISWPWASTGYVAHMYALKMLNSNTLNDKVKQS